MAGKIAKNRVTVTNATGNYRKPEAAQNKVAVNRQACNVVRHDTTLSNKHTVRGTDMEETDSAVQ
jgi:hypothetical protein